MKKILFIGFGIPPFCSGGAVEYQQSLINAVSKNSWNTVCFFAAPRYKFQFSNKPFIVEYYKNQIKYIELFNALNHFSALNNPDDECKNLIIHNLTEKIIDDEKPDIVHIHELQLHCASIIDILNQKKIPAIKTMHNYYDICPQRDLWYCNETNCIDFDEGKNCVKCLANRLKYKSHLYFSGLSLSAKILKTICKYFLQTLQNFEVSVFKKNIFFSAEQYNNRRKYFLEKLNKLDIIHCSSIGSAEIFMKYGVQKEKIKIIPIATERIEIIKKKKVRGVEYPIVFGYAGGLNKHKGYEILIDAFSKLNQKKVKLVVWESSAKKILKPRGLAIEYKKPYNKNCINEAFKDIDVGIIPSIWNEVFALIGNEWIKAGIPVIASNIGGITQWLVDNENGFLFTAGDSAALAEKMKRFVDNPSLISEFQNKMSTPQTFDEHIFTMLKLYENAIN